MGISNLTIIIIASRGNDIRADVGGPNGDGKYVGWVVLHRPNGEHDHELLGGSSVDTREEALEMAQSVIDIIRSNVSSKDVKEMVEEMISTLETGVSSKV